jgi:serine/threonine protein kinase
VNTKFQNLFSIKGLLGVGAFGVVILVFNKVTNEKSALKIINKTKLSNSSLEVLRNESLIL